KASVSRYGQLRARQDVLHAAGLNLLVDFGGKIVVIAESFIDLGRRQLWQTFEDFFNAETQLVIAHDGLNGHPGALDDGTAAANVRHTGDVTIIGDTKGAHVPAPDNRASSFRQIISSNGSGTIRFTLASGCTG